MISERIDRELSAGALGASGDFWARHATTATRRAMDHIARAASGPFGYFGESSERFVSGEVVQIVDGDFFVAGGDPEAFVFSTIATDVVGLRDMEFQGRSGTLTAWVGKLNRGGGQAIELPDGHDWCVFGCDDDLLALSLGYTGGVLVRGVDFLSWPGIVAVRDNPAELWPDGVVTVIRGVRRVAPMNVFVMSGDTGQHSTRWLAEYARRRQSITAFRRAAAEYCGMFVLAEDDLLLRAGNGVYTFAKSGLVRVDYPHRALSAGVVYAAGHVIGDLDCFVPRWDALKSTLIAEADSTFNLPGADGDIFSLDGIFPVNGLTWNSALPVLLAAGPPSPETGKNYGEWEFGGDTAALARLNVCQAAREDSTGEALIDEFGELPVYLDFGAFLSFSFGDSLVVVRSEATGDTRAKLREFVFNNKPYGCNILWQHAVG